MCIYILIGHQLGRFLPLVPMFLTKRYNPVLSISGCAGSLLLRTLFSSFDDGGGVPPFSRSAQACAGPSPCRAGAPGHRPRQLPRVGSVVTVPGLHSRSTGAQSLCVMWHPPRVSCIGRQAPRHWVTRAYDSILMCAFNLFKFIYSIY